MDAFALHSRHRVYQHHEAEEKEDKGTGPRESELTQSSSLDQHRQNKCWDLVRTKQHRPFKVYLLLNQ